MVVWVYGMASQDGILSGADGEDQDGRWGQGNWGGNMLVTDPEKLGARGGAKGLSAGTETESGKGLQTSGALLGMC